MQIDNEEFKDLKEKVEKTSETVDKIYCWVTGDEFQNGANPRLKRLEKKDRKRDRRWWLTIGGLTIIIFLIKWGDQIIQLL